MRSIITCFFDATEVCRLRVPDYLPPWARRHQCQQRRRLHHPDARCTGIRNQPSALSTMQNQPSAPWITPNPPMSCDPQALNSLNQMPNLPQSPAPNQTIHLPLDRTESSIPRDQSAKWEYPSPQQFYNALVRKGWENARRARRGDGRDP